MLTGNRGFVLPFVVLLTGVIMVVVVLILDQAEFEFRDLMRQSIKQRAQLCLKMNTKPLIAALEQVLKKQPAATYLVQEVMGDTRVHITGIYTGTGKQNQRLSSGSCDAAVSQVGFSSPLSSLLLQSELIEIGSDDNRQDFQLAWAFEDIALTAAGPSTSSWWPLNDWQLAVAAVPEKAEIVQISGLKDPIPAYIPAQTPLPYSPERDPRIVPVLRQVSLNFGIFASGISGQREKVIRMRFYIDCTLWNPYSRPMEFHERTGNVPAFQMAFRNLPLLRIVNETKGVSTGWVDIDSLRNSQSGTTGIHAWIRLKAQLQPGETLTLREPDPKLQPEGLARIVHPAFMVSPADRVRIEFKSKASGVSLTCLELDVTDPVNQQENTSAWVLYENFNLQIPLLEFPRADEPEKPFYIDAGSLSFRRHNAQVEVVVRSPERKFIDPRRQIVSAMVEYPDASGSNIPGSQLAEFSATVAGQAGVSTPEPQAWPAVVSWPTNELRQMMEFTDLPEWINSNFLGTEGAVSINSLLDIHWPFALPKFIQQAGGGGRTIQYAKSIHINNPGMVPWINLLTGESESTATGTSTSLAMYPNPVTKSDFLEIDEMAVKSIAGRLANRAITDPSHSISDFFNRGELGRLLPARVDARLIRLLSLRGLWGKGYQLVSHGNAFILHVACLVRHRGREVPATARIWLLQVPGETNRTNMEIIRFEWTDPAEHLLQIR